MIEKRLPMRVAALAIVPATVCAGAPAAAHQSLRRHHALVHWVASWTASPTDSFTPFDASETPVPMALDDQTLRMIITPHRGGSTLRVHLSNRFGNAPTRLGPVTVGAATKHGVRRIQRVTFSARGRVTIATGQDVISDPVHLRFTAFEPLAVSMFVPGSQQSPTKHWNANATSYYSPSGSGDLSGAHSDAGFRDRTQAWLYVDGLDVRAPRDVKAVVAFGDSITDGFVAANPFSQPVSTAIADKNGRYPDDLQRRLDRAGIPVSVVNAGIGSNRLVTDGEPLMMGLSGLQRFRQDALDVAGVRGILLQEGINDFGLPPATTTPQQLIAGYREAIARAHAAGLKIWLGTLLPASNAVFDGTATAPNSERYREAANHWIRHQKLADGVVDFARRLRDPANHKVLDPRYSGPDHLHPNLRGYRVMARLIPLKLLR